MCKYVYKTRLLGVLEVENVRGISRLFQNLLLKDKVLKYHNVVNQILTVHENSIKFVCWFSDLFKQAALKKSFLVHSPQFLQVFFLARPNRSSRRLQYLFLELHYQHNHTTPRSA